MPRFPRPPRLDPCFGAGAAPYGAGNPRHQSEDNAGASLGHTDVGNTARYVHLARDSAKESATLMAASIAADIMP